MVYDIYSPEDMEGFNFVAPSNSTFTPRYGAEKDINNAPIVPKEISEQLIMVNPQSSIKTEISEFDELSMEQTRDHDHVFEASLKEIEIVVEPCPPVPEETQDLKFVDVPRRSSVAYGKGHTKRNDQAVCPQCDKKFTRAYDLKRHIRSKHQHLKDIICQYCSKAYTRQNTLNDHIDRHHL